MNERAHVRASTTWCCSLFLHKKIHKNSVQNSSAQNSVHKVCTKLSTCPNRVALRAGTTDMHVFKQIFMEHFLQDMVMAAPRDTEYILVGVPLCALVCNRMSPHVCTYLHLHVCTFLYKMILTPCVLQPQDAGGNAGFSTMLFAGLWPSASVIVVEPDEANLKVGVGFVCVFLLSTQQQHVYIHRHMYAYIDTCVYTYAHTTRSFSAQHHCSLLFLLIIATLSITIKTLVCHHR